MTTPLRLQRLLLVLALAMSASIIGWRRYHPVPPATLAQQLSVGSARRADRRWEAHVVLRETDCVSNTAFLLLLQRPHVTTGMSLQHAWVVDDGGTVEEASASLRARGIETSVSLLPRAAEAQLTMIGAARTPLLVVFDDSGLLRLMTPAPQTPTEFAALSSTLESLRQTF